MQSDEQPQVEQTAQPAIACTDLLKRFGDFTAVNSISLEVKSGEIYGFLGPNGAGKTTTIKMLTGLLGADSGTATICGYDIVKQPLDARRMFGYIPDNPYLYEKLTGVEFLNFMADLYNMPRKDRAQSVADLLALFALESKAHTLIQGYSRGMRQKIALAGALIHHPRVIFLDEPTVGLDPQSALAMQEILRELGRRGTTIFVSTHILEIAEKMCHRVAIVNRGEIIAQGTVAELQAWSANQPDADSHAGPASLEHIFLQLTGGDEYADRIRFLT